MKIGEKKLTAIFSAALIIVLALSSTAYAITGNYEPDDGRHPYVGLLVFDVYVPDVGNVPAWRCTGSLIAPKVVLCAGHCCEGAVAARFWFYEDVTYDNVPFPLYPYGGPGSGAIEGTPYTNPDYRSIDANGNGIPTFSYRDVGIVVLDEPVDLAEYAELPEAGLVDTLAVMTDVDLVGYGVQYQEMPPPKKLGPYYAWTGPRQRFYAPAQLLSGEFSWSDEFVRCSANPARGKGGTAFGDSGGPVLLGGTNTILAVNSYVTSVNCKGTTYHSRVDIPEVLEWINEEFLD
jgi:hypothetical protein